MQRRCVSRVPGPLVLVLTGMVLALPLLGMDCEMACARSHAERQSATSHCAAHDDSAPAGATETPAPGGCGHHAHAAVFKQVSEGAQRGLRVAGVPAALLAPIARAGRRSWIGVTVSAREAAPPWSTARPDILRL